MKPTSGFEPLTGALQKHCSGRAELRRLEGWVGFEPTTCWLTASCSGLAELPTHKSLWWTPFDSNDFSGINRHIYQGFDLLPIVISPSKPLCYSAHKRCSGLLYTREPEVVCSQGSTLVIKLPHKGSSDVIMTDILIAL